MKSILGVILLIIILTLNLQGQNYMYAYLVEFTDKENSPYSIHRPEQFLSQRAIDRREKYGITITEEDLPVNRNYIDSLTKLGAKFHNASKWMNSAVFLTDSLDFNFKAESFPFVNKTSLIYLKINRKSISSTHKLGSITADGVPMAIDYGASENQVTMLNGHMLHNQGYLGQGMHIAVLDAGFLNVNQLSCFDSLFADERVLGTYDFVKNDSSVYEDYYHGMAVLSTMAANQPGKMVGTAPKASYWLLRTEDVFFEFPIEEENWIAAAEFADSAGADILTTSLGYSTFDVNEMSYSYSDMDGKTTRITRGSEIAFSKGMFLVNSAGNEGNSGWLHITAPSDGENVLCIGAVDNTATVTSFSSRGPSYDNRVKPDVMAQGGGTTVISATGEVANGSGTSYSGPVAAGMVACLWQSHPDLTNGQLLDFIRKSGDKYTQPDSVYGFGVPDFAKALLLIDSIDFEDYNDENLTRVFPNPVNNTLHFDFYSLKAQTLVVKLINGQGALVYSSSVNVMPTSYNKLKIANMNEFPRGVYVLVIDAQGKSFNKKVIKY